MSITSLLDCTDVSGGRRSGPSSTPKTSGSGSAPSTVNKKIAQRQIVHPIFEECIAYTFDEFWKKTLYMAARGKFPKGFFYRDNFICHKKKNRNRSTFIPSDPIEAVNVFTSFMKEAGTLSNLDAEYQKEQMQFSVTSGGTGPIDTWSKVPKKLKNSYIEDYVNKICTGYNLSDSCRSSMRQTICQGVCLKIFNKDTIHMSNGGILNIDGLRYEADTDTFVIEQAAWNAGVKKILASSECPPYNPLDVMRPSSIYEPDGVAFRSEWEKRVGTLTKISNASTKMRKTMERQAAKSSEQIIIGTGQLIIIEG